MSTSREPRNGTPDRAPDRGAPASSAAAGVGDGDERRQQPRIALDRSQLINREISLLEFNRRVLALAEDVRLPLLERLQFLAICSTNLDEFFEVRVAGLRQRIALGITDSTHHEDSSLEVLDQVSRRAKQLVAEQYALLNREILPALAEHGIHVLSSSEWNASMHRAISAAFEREVLPVLTPVGLDPSHPFPAIVNKSLNFLVTLEGVDGYDRDSRVAVVQAPRLLPRLIAVPAPMPAGGEAFVTLSSMIRANVDLLFPGMTVRGCHAFRVTRDSNLWLNEEEIDDLLRALQGELPRRRYGNSVRLEVDETCPPEIQQQLLREFGLGEDDLYRVDGPVNMHRLSALYDLVDRPELKFPRFRPQPPGGAAMLEDPFAAIRANDVLLHHPFQPFEPVVDLVRRAASDPDVLAIKATLYRTGRDSPFTEALLQAARNGKEVTAVIELRARFDEEQNIDTAMRLQDVGAKVVYGVGGFKTHAKMVLIVRREADGIRRYVHLGTGNYHYKTTGSYTDFGLLTCDPDLTADAHELFQQLTGLGAVRPLRKAVQAPFALHALVMDLIERETAAAAAGQPARIRAKMNALIEPDVIAALYRASQAGVEVDLVVRGICCLRPGLPGLSDNIRVRSVLGRFLEHHRIYHFHAGGKRLTYLASADWMPRNFFRRIELAFPIEDPVLRQRVLHEGLEVYLGEDVDGWDLQADGSYRRTGGSRQPQDQLLEALTASP